MTRPLKRFVTLLTALVLTACASSIHVDLEEIDEPGNISSATTYRWDDASLSGIAPGEVISTDFSDAIRDEIDRFMASRGYQLISTGSADMTLSFRVTVKESIGRSLNEDPFYPENYVSPYGIKWRFGDGERPVVVEKATAQVQLSFYQEGTLHIAAFDAGKRLSWHASAHKIINDLHSPQEHEAVLRRTVQAIMQRFPHFAASPA